PFRFVWLIVALGIVGSVVLAQQEKFARDRVYDVQHMKMEFAFDIPKKVVYGRVTNWLRPLHQPLSVVELDAAGLKIKSVTLVGGGSLKYETTADKLRVSLPRPFTPQEQIGITVVYEAGPRRPSNLPFGFGLRFIAPDSNDPNAPLQVWSLNQPDAAHTWIPCYDYPNDKTTTEVILTVPKGMVGVSNGTLASVKANPDGTRVFHWKQMKPHSTYLISVAVGDLVYVKDKPYDGIPIGYWVPRRHEKNAIPAFGNTPEMVKFFSEKIGVKYPWDKYDTVTVHGFGGGMEHTSATTVGEGSLHDARAKLDVSSDDLLAHELAHQWWGDLLTCKDWSHIWLNEGFATYFALLWTEYKEGKEAFQSGVNSMFQGGLAADAGPNKRPVVWRGYAAPNLMFGAHAYPKGGSVLHMLRGVLGDDLFWKGLKLYATRHAYQPVETEHLRLALQDASDRDLTWFFHQWLYKAGYPAFQVRYEWDEAAQQVKVIVKQTQQTSDLVPIFRMPVDIYVTTAAGRQKQRVWVEKAEHEFVFPAASRPLMVNFDPEQWVLKTLDFPKSKEEWLYTLRNAPWVVERQRAVTELGRVKDDPVVVAALRDAALRDKFVGVRSSALTAAAAMETSPASRDFLLQALNDRESRIRRAAIAALERYAAEPVVQDALRKVFRTDPSYFAQAAALSVLVKGKPSDIGDLLMKAAKMDSYRDMIRSAAMRGFAELNDQRGLSLALEVLDKAESFSGRRDALHVIARLAPEADPDAKRQVRERLLKMARAAPRFVQSNIFDTLAALKDADTAAELDKLANDTTTEQSVREAAKSAAQKIREEGR
ncbi:MAG: M1 family aminopeptidase, partial [Abditibacteriales bacterium]|nr:M1 family aminopeptidase [Abditibacteriales bacterium]MDW8367722.1 M1 family aminopeptidase [Abditibacteriales bacterium]